MIGYGLMTEEENVYTSAVKAFLSLIGNTGFTKPLKQWFRTALPFPALWSLRFHSGKAKIFLFASPPLRCASHIAAV